MAAPSTITVPVRIEVDVALGRDELAYVRAIHDPAEAGAPAVSARALFLLAWLERAIGAGSPQPITSETVAKLRAELAPETHGGGRFSITADGEPTPVPVTWVDDETHTRCADEDRAGVGAPASAFPDVTEPRGDDKDPTVRPALVRRPLADAKPGAGWLCRGTNAEPHPSVTNAVGARCGHCHREQPAQ